MKKRVSYEAFVLTSSYLGRGEVLYSWSKSKNIVAATGTSKVVHVIDQDGNVVHQVVPPKPSICTFLEWSPVGSSLAVFQQNSLSVVLSCVDSKVNRTVHLNNAVTGKNVVCIQWICEDSFVFSVNSGRVYQYEVAQDTTTEWPSVQRHTALSITVQQGARGSKRPEDKNTVVCCIAFSNKTVRLYNSTGAVVDDIKLKDNIEQVGFNIYDNDILFGIINKTEILIHNIKESKSSNSAAKQSKSNKAQQGADGRHKNVHPKHKNVQPSNNEEEKVTSREKATSEHKSVDSKENSLLLSFSNSYGSVLCVSWIASKKLVVGFSMGVIMLCVVDHGVVIETEAQGVFCPTPLEEIRCNRYGFCAVSGGGALWILDLITLEPYASKVILPNAYNNAIMNNNKHFASATSGGQLSHSKTQHPSTHNKPSQSTTHHKSKGANTSGVGEFVLNPQWNCSGNILSIATNTGCLYAYGIITPALNAPKPMIIKSLNPVRIVMHPIQMRYLFATYCVSFLCVVFGMCVTCGVTVTELGRVWLGVSSVL